MMVHSTVEAALRRTEQPASVAQKVISTVEQELQTDESVASAKVGLIGTPTSSDDPIGVIVVTSERILAAYKPSGLMARPEVIQLSWDGLSMAARARAGEDPAVAIYHDAGDLFINCGQGYDSARDELVDCTNRLLLRQVERFSRRPDVAGWFQRLGEQDIQHVESSYGYGALVRNFPDAERVRAVIPATVATVQGVLTLTESRLFFFPNDGNQDWLLNAWPGGIGAIECSILESSLDTVLVPSDPEQWLAGAEVKASVLGLDHANAVKISIGLDTPRETLQELRDLLEAFRDRSEQLGDD